jgi:hypothetical protein
MNQVLALIILGSFWACGSVSLESAENNEGEQVYKTYFVAYHGADGKLKLNDSPGLTFSFRTLDERIKTVLKVDV